MKTDHPHTIKSDPPDPSQPAPEGQGTARPAAAQPESHDAPQPLQLKSPNEPIHEKAHSTPSRSLAAGREAGERQRAQEEELAALLDGVVRGQERMMGVLNRAVDSLAGFQARLDALESRLRDVDLRQQSMRNAGYGST